MQQQSTSLYPPLQVRAGVLVVDGFGIALRVLSRGKLRVDDGIGRQRRSLTLDRAGCGLERLVLIGHAGYVTLEALSWLRAIGAALVQIGRDGEVLAHSAPFGYDGHPIRRAQALAVTNGLDLFLARELIASKLDGQRRILVWLHADLREFDKLRAAVDAADSIERVRVIEANAAALYLPAWRDVRIRFRERDLARIPARWLRCDSRASALTGAPRAATSPLNALRNYLFACLESEARLALLAHGLDPALGVFDPKTGKQRQLWCLAISAKRYVLFLRDRNGEPELLRKGVNNGEDGWSQHGLGHLLNPSDPTSEDRSWIAQAWLSIVRQSLALATKPLPFADRVALGQITVSSPEVLRPLAKLNAGKSYAEQIKPFSFILSCHVAPYGHPADADPERFHLIAPYETDPRKWLALPWIDQYSGKQYRISTILATGTRQIARVKSYGDVLEEYEFHEEAKCADASGEPCDKQTVGLLHRRHVTIEWPPRFIGKESNRLEEVEVGSVADAGDVYTEYPDPRRDEWATKVLPFLRRVSAQEIIESTGISRRTVQRIRNEQSKPTAEHRFLLETFSRGRNYCPQEELILQTQLTLDSTPGTQQQEDYHRAP